MRQQCKQLKKENKANKPKGGGNVKLILQSEDCGEEDDGKAI